MNPYYPYNHKYYEKLLNKISDKFNVVKHELTDHLGFPVGQGLNYWDSLFVEK
jgi:hypothetical protein